MLDSKRKLVPVMSAQPDAVRSEEFELWIDDKHWDLDVRSSEEPFIELPVALRTHGLTREYTLRVTARGMTLIGTGKSLESWWRKS